MNIRSIIGAIMFAAASIGAQAADKLSKDQPIEIVSDALEVKVSPTCAPTS
jgi:hypothetical protein